MARVTVEDCIEIVPNRFKLVVLAARRARDLAAGAYLTVPRDNDKNPVVALREIAEKSVDVETLEKSIIRHMQKAYITDDTEADLDQELQDSFAQETQMLSHVNIKSEAETHFGTEEAVSDEVDEVEDADEDNVDDEEEDNE